MKYLYILSLVVLFFSVSRCSGQEKVKKKEKVTQDGYRYVSFGKIPSDKMGKKIGRHYWDKTYYINKPAADSFYIYGSFDSIRMKTPAERFGTIFRKVDIHAISWKPKPDYDDFSFVGNFVTDSLPGFYMSYYFTKDRSGILQLHYTDPGNLNGVILFTKDSVNVLKRSGVNIDPRDEQ
jgi:hypothetical protein